MDEELSILIQERTISLKALVGSQNTKGAYYIVTLSDEVWDCSCPDCQDRGNDNCKHIKRAKAEL